jgi:ATP-dependent Zn protease
MTDIKTLENILHRERIRKYKNTKGVESWDKKYNKLCIELGYPDLATRNPQKITEWKERNYFKRQDNLDRKRLKNLQRASNMLLKVSMYPFALLIFLFVIFNL